MKDIKLNIEYLPIDQLKPYERNTRKHEAKDINAIKASIEQFGFDDPIGIWKNTIVEGHGRLIAAKELGMETVPVIRLDHLTDEQRKAYAIAHNKTAEVSDWDRLVLGGELRELEDMFDMTDFGFGDFELNLLTHADEMAPVDYEDEDGIGDYDSLEKEHLAKQRVIITYNDESKAALMKMMGLEELTKVLYDITELTDNE